MTVRTLTRRVDMRGELVWFGRRFEVPEACLRGSLVTATGRLDSDEIAIEAPLLGGKPSLARPVPPPAPPEALPGHFPVNCHPARYRSD